MANLPVQFNDGNQLAALPQEMLAAFGQMYNNAFSGVSGSAFRSIKVRKTDFFLNDGGDGESIPFNGLYAVLLHAADCNHAVWYKKKYAPGQAPEAPDLVWKFPDYETFPDALPAQYRQKVEVQGQMRWDFSIRRRTVWAVLRNNAQTGQMYIDFDHPYVFDIPSSSMYGKSNPDQNEYKWGGLSQVCDKYSVNGVRVYPGMFVVQIVPDSRGTQGTVLFKPMLNAQTGSLQMLSNELIAKVFELTQRADIKQLCEVREKLTLDDAAPAAAPVQVAQQVAQPAPQMVPPVQVAQQPVAPQPQPQPQPAPVQVAPQPQPAPVQVAPQPQPQPAPVMPSEASDAMMLLAEANAMMGSVNPQPAAPVQQPQPAAPVQQPVSATAANNIAAMMAALK